MRGGCTTVEDQVGLRPRHRQRNAAAQAGQPARTRARRCGSCRTLLALHALPADQRDRRAHYVSEIVDKLIPQAAKAKLATSVDAFCETIALHARGGRAACSRPPPSTGFESSSTPSNYRTSTAPRSPPQHRALSADHLEHLDEAGAKAMAEAGHGRGAAARRLLCAAGRPQAAGRPAARAQGADRHRHRLQPRHLAFAVADPGDEHGVHPVRPDAGGGARRNDHQRRARARPRQDRSAASLPARPPTSASGGSKPSPSSATGSACRPERRILPARTLTSSAWS